MNKSLQRDGFKSGEIHGDIDQGSRIAELERFRAGTVNILVASDVAARGLDIKGVSHVFNYDAPWHPDDYVHRIGRTGRAGASGVAYTFVTEADAEAIDNIQKLIGTKIEVVGAAEAIASAEPTAESAPKTPRGRKPRAAKPAAQAAVADEPAAEKPSPARRSRAQKPREEAAASPAAAPRAAEAPARQRRNDHQDDGPDEGWNGPVPEFLNFGFDA